MDCRQEYGTVPCVPAQDGLETHGVCAGCVPAREAEIAAIRFTDARRSLVPAGTALHTPEIARVIGLPEAEVVRLRPRHWVREVDFVLSGGVQFWRRESLSELVGELVVSGHLTAAKRLLSFLIGEQEQRAAAGGGKNWLAKWEEENA